MKKNHRYSSSGKSRKAIRQQRLALLAGLCVSVLVAALCGRSLDQRYRVASSRVSSLSTEGRASLNLPRIGSLSKEIDVRQRIERISGVAGKALLSRDRWQASDPVLVDGVEVSDMLTQPFFLRRSLQIGYRAERIVVDAAWTQADSFLDLGLGANANGGIVLRFSKGSVQSFLRSHSGALIPNEAVSGAGIAACERYEVSVPTDSVSVSCAGETILQISYPSVAQGKLFVASNLAGAELRELSIKGVLGGLSTEDVA